MSQAPAVGAASAPTVDATPGLQLENSFVSAKGWVKPDETYPSRIIVTNPAAVPSGPATVTVDAPVGTTFTDARGAGSPGVTPTQITWTVPSVPAAADGKPGSATLVIESRAKTLQQVPTLVWRDLSTTATLTEAGQPDETDQSHGPKVIPPNGDYDTARYGDRPFPVVPVQYRDRAYQADHDGAKLDKAINDPTLAGSTFNLFQEMSLGQLFPKGTVPSDGIATANFTDYAPGFDFTELDPATVNTCTGGATKTGPVPAPGTVGGATYTERITDGVYNLPGNTAYYGADGNGSAVVGSLTGQGALMQIDSGCGPTSKLVWDAAAIADPEIDYSDYDTDKDGVVDFFMAVFAGCGGNGASQLSLPGDPVEACPYGDPSYDNVWPHSSSLEYYYTDPDTGLAGFTTDDQLEDLEGRPMFYTTADRTQKTTTQTQWPVYVRIGPYNLNPETAIDKASVISHEYGHSLGLPDFYSLGGRETYGDWNLMATDKSQHMDAYSRQELGWVVPQVLEKGSRKTVSGWTDSKEDIGTIHWQTPDGTPYTLNDGTDGNVRNSEMYAASLPGRNLLDPAKFETGDKASASHAWFSGSGNDFGCAADGKGHNLDLAVPGLADLPEGSTVELTMKSMFDIEWDFDYGYVLTSTDGGKNFSSHPSTRSVPTTSTTNPNTNACQAKYSNGISGSSASYSDQVTVTKDRLLGEYPASTFIADSFDISDLAGAATPILRFSYSTDPGLARPGWFMDDVKVSATLPGGAKKELLVTDFEDGDMDPADARVFNGGCRDESFGGTCTKGWQFVKAGDEASFDHAYYLEMRDRSGFDLDGRGQIDRDPIGWQAGLYVAYTDEAHGYGNAGTDDPPAQTPIDATPTPGEEAPVLDDAAFTTAGGRSSYSDSGQGHTDNYTNPSEQVVDPRYPDVPNPWRFQYDCLGFDVQSMSGNGDGPVGADGDLTGTVAFTMGSGCGSHNYGYGAADVTPNTAPGAQATASPSTGTPDTEFTFDARSSTDAETPNDLDYSWDLDGDGTKDAVGPVVTKKYAATGSHTAEVTVTDPSGGTDTAETTVTVSSSAPAANTNPTARMKLGPSIALTTRRAVLDGSPSTDKETASGSLTYRWNFNDGGSTVDATGRTATPTFSTPGTRRITLTVTDPQGGRSVSTGSLVVRRELDCRTNAVSRHGSWRTRPGTSSTYYWLDYCDNQGRGSGSDTLTSSFTGSRLQVVYARARTGGTARIVIDGKVAGRIAFDGGSSSTPAMTSRVFTGLGGGRHTVKLVVTGGAAYVEGFVVDR
jgi:hypothetical protein